MPPSSSNIQAGRTLDALVNSVDIVPTVLDIAAFRFPPNCNVRAFEHWTRRADGLCSASLSFMTI